MKISERKQLAKDFLEVAEYLSTDPFYNYICLAANFGVVLSDKSAMRLISHLRNSVKPEDISTDARDGWVLRSEDHIDDRVMFCLFLAEELKQ